VGSGRFDDPHGEFRVLHATVQRRAAFIETLAPFRPSLEVLAALAAMEGMTNAEEPVSRPRIPAEWGSTEHRHIPWSPYGFTAR